MSETEALTVPETRRGIITRDVLTEAAEQRKLLAEYVRAQMVEGTDYGKIPGTDKPTLLKPGAEKLTELFRCTPKFKLVKEIEDYDKNLFAYTFRVQLYQRDAGAVLAEGYGSANSREGRYRWRNANPRCPSCGKEALFRSKNDPGFYCWSKKGGCGAKFGPNDPGVKAAFASAGKVENDDVATLANTILKMAKKRALVDGAIALARVSDLFTQDVEDLPHGAPAEDVPPPAAEKPATENGHAPAQATQKAAVPRGEQAVENAKAYTATVAEIAAASSAGDLAVIGNRLPEIAVTEGQRRILKARLDARLKQVGGAQA